jgi:hypothetical protein
VFIPWFEQDNAIYLRLSIIYGIPNTKIMLRPARRIIGLCRIDIGETGSPLVDAPMLPDFDGSGIYHQPSRR